MSIPYVKINGQWKKAGNLYVKEQAAGPQFTEDFTQWTEYDPEESMELTSPTVLTFTQMQRLDTCHCYVDGGANYFGNNGLDIDLDIDIDAIGGGNYGTVWWGLTNTLGGTTDFNAADDGLGFLLQSYGGLIGNWLKCWVTDNQTNCVNSALTLRYYTMTWNGTTMAMYIYTTAERTVLFDSASITTAAPVPGGYRYMIVSSQNIPGGTPYITGTVQNIVVNDRGSTETEFSSKWKKFSGVLHKSSGEWKDHNPPILYEILTEYTEVENDGDYLDVTADTITFTALPINVESYVYKDFGAGYFDDYTIEFEGEVTNSGLQGFVIACALTNTLGSRQAMITANEGVYVMFWRDNADGKITVRIKDENTDQVDFWKEASATGTFGPYYFRVIKSGATITCYIYDDAARTSLVDQISVTCEDETKRYFEACASSDQTGTNSITGYVKNYKIIV